jgi:hypothetical protein
MVSNDIINKLDVYEDFGQQLQNIPKNYRKLKI